MVLKSRYNSDRNVYEIGYYAGTGFVIVHTHRVL